MRSVVFLDRDGTINLDSGYVTSPDRVELIPGAAEAISKLRQFGFSIVVVTNQSAVGRGMASLADIEATNQELKRMLLAENKDAILDQILFSIASPEQQDDTRKPGIGMLRELKGDYDPKTSWVMGDKLSDLQFGQNAKLPSQNCVLLLTGEGKKQQNLTQPDLISGFRVANDILQAACAIVTGAWA